MKNKTLIFISAILLLCSTASAQEYTGMGYWKMEHDSSYQYLLKLQKSGDSLSIYQQNYLSDFKARLSIYFDRMSDNEKSNYYKNRSSWADKSGKVIQEEDQVFSGDRSTFSQYVAASGVFGFFYGGAFDVIFGFENEGAVGLPLVSAGLSTIIPLATIKDKKVTTNSLLLSLHGKSIGAYQGMMMGLLFTGNSNSEDFPLKLTLGLATASSIVLGKVGYNLGRDKNWTQGRVSLYAHYGWLMPMEGLALTAAFNIQNPSVYGGVSLVFGAGGYLVADRMANRYNFTRGDVVSFQSVTFLNTILGFGIMSEGEADSPAAFLIPAIGALSGTLIGQECVKNAGLTNQQGRNTMLAASGGAAVGLGLAVMINAEAVTPYYLLPYLGGITSYALVLKNYKNKNGAKPFVPPIKNGLQISFTPQNIILNNKLYNAGIIKPGSRISMLPAFAATFNF
jgi:hypothetical protein